MSCSGRHTILFKNFWVQGLSADKGSICINTSGSHNCVCQAGWTGDGISCVVWFNVIKFDNVNGKLLEPDHKISTNVQLVLIAVQGNFRKVELFLYNFTEDYRSNGADCQNNDGGYSCDGCLQGWTGNGYHCNDVDECLDGDLNRRVTFFSERLLWYIMTLA